VRSAIEIDKYNTIQYNIIRLFMAADALTKPSVFALFRRVRQMRSLAKDVLWTESTSAQIKPFCSFVVTVAFSMLMYYAYNPDELSAKLWIIGLYVHVGIQILNGGV